ncbi:AMP-binding protein [Patulibacter minatonensis]|uniref:AMP-binding protein n=1 Tax=Patulibacter minatonensis TaxID=298163 RepID=UPI000479443F|nr:AMP-binding protein [Patulibacter minatonensis]
MSSALLHQTVGDLLDRATRAYVDRDAIVEGESRLTFGAFGEAVRRAGHAFRALGLEPGDRVSILSADRTDLLVAFYGTIAAGFAVSPLNARMSEEDHVFIVGDSGAKVLVHDGAFAERAGRIATETGVRLVSLDDDGPDGFQALLAAQPAEGRAGAPEPADLAAIFYTGGTTGRPKGVAHTQQSLVTSFLSEALEMGLYDRTVFAHAAPLTHSSGMFCIPVWMRGGTNVILGGFDPAQMLAAIERDRITSMLVVPTMLYVLLDHPDFATRDLSSLQTVIYGAAPMGRERLLQAIDRLGPIFVQLYGQTEAPNQICALTAADHADAIERGDLDVLSSCGKPVTIADVRVVDDEGNEVPVGERGEIVCRGPHVMLEYWNKPEQTAETLIDGWLHTGDIATVDARGFLRIVDRKKDMLISGGFNVYPKEVESCLFQHPKVRDVCVIGVPDEKWGEAVKAIVVTDGEVDPKELMLWVKERKGSVMTPKSVDRVDAIPLTAVGKHDKPALRRQYAEATA